MLKIDKGFGRTILVDLEQPGKNLVAMGFEVEGPDIAYRIMPHGRWAVRIMTPEPTEVVIQLDGKTLLDTEIEAGVHTLHQGKDGTAFIYTRPGAEAQHVVVSDTPKSEPEAKDEKNERPKRFLAPSHGLVIVSLRIKPTKPQNAPELPPDEFVDLLFQMNPWAEHNKAVAANLSKMVAPEIPADGHGMTDENGKPIHIHVPHFRCGFRQ